MSHAAIKPKHLPLGPVLDERPVFDVQLTLDAEAIGLHCRNCGFTFDVDRDYLEPRGGDAVGCPKCARIHTLPTIRRNP